MHDHDDPNEPLTSDGPALLPQSCAGEGPVAWSPEVIEAQAVLLAEVMVRAPRALRRRARAALRAAWISVEAARAEQPEPRVRWSCYRSGRDLERLIYEARHIPLPERSWMQHGVIFTVRRIRTVRIRTFVAYALIRDVERRFVEFGREGEPFREWLWARVSEHLPPDDPNAGGARMREAYELVYGRGRRET